ncbi:MAG: formate dehydrogenase accessory sulfurtransferase FdhD [Candidatus Syntropharchaeia archaeon]
MKENESREIEDNVCIEEKFYLYLNDGFVSELIASPDQLRELGAGFVVCQGLAENVKDVHISGNEIRVYSDNTESKKKQKDVAIKKEDVFEIISKIESDIWRKTGGVHCSVLFSRKIVISKGASTDKGIRTADEAGVTLICFAREGRFTVYTHPYRIRM